VEWASRESRTTTDELRDDRGSTRKPRVSVAAKSCRPPHNLHLAQHLARRRVRDTDRPGHKAWERSTCGYCKEPLPRKGLKFYGRHCYLRYSVEVAKPIEKAQVRLAEMRAAGLSSGHGGQAAAKRGAKIAESNRRRSLRPTASNGY
jgi:hypothetical protein